ncbi:hypothetical protein MKW94_019856 [Papaver nudicaule]|uniref:N-acetyltransferase domain-containing protein n=1 Tax=Papaver nudicaule TaxID=74823 RepID=A0AA42B0R4_PAPNU|nr:hypothetical protein [Papaver nudicaule]
MVFIRLATLADIPEIKACALVCDPSSIKELDPAVVNSFLKDCILSPLDVVYVAECGGRIVGHVIGNMLICYKSKKEAEDEEEERREGYIRWLGVHPTHRKLGIATKLMTAAEKALVQEYGSEYVNLHVLVSNLAAVNLYTKILGYKIQIHDILAKFLDDGEDAYLMRKQLPDKQPQLQGRKATHGGGCFSSKANVALGWKLLRNVMSTEIKKKFSLRGYRNNNKNPFVKQIAVLQTMVM